jgi:hypothetical protein
MIKFWLSGRHTKKKAAVFPPAYAQIIMPVFSMSFIQPFKKRPKTNQAAGLECIHYSNSC